MTLVFSLVPHVLGHGPKCERRQRPVTHKRVPDREEQGKPSKDARRGRCHPIEAGFWPLCARALNRDISVSLTSWHKGVILGRNSVFGVFRL